MYLCAMVLFSVLSSQLDFTQLVQQGRLEYRAGRFAESEKRFLAALAMLEPHDDAHRAPALAELADVYVNEDEFDKAERAYSESLEIYKRLPDKQYTVVLLRDLGTTYAFQQRYGDALRLLQQALKLAESSPGNDTQVAQVLNSMGMVNYWQGKHAKAEEFFSKALQLISISGPRFDLSELLNNLGAVYVTNRKFEKAEPLLERALELREAEVGPSHPDLTFTLDALALLYTESARYAEAENQYLRILKILEPAAQTFETRIGRTLQALSNTYTKAGRKAEANDALARAAAIAHRNLGRHPEMIVILENYSALLKKQGKTKEADALRAEAKRARISSSIVINARSLRPIDNR